MLCILATLPWVILNAQAFRRRRVGLHGQCCDRAVFGMNWTVQGHRRGFIQCQPLKSCVLHPLLGVWGVCEAGHQLPSEAWERGFLLLTASLPRSQTGGSVTRARMLQEVASPSADTTKCEDTAVGCCGIINKARDRF